MPRARLIFDGDGVYTEKEARIHKLTQETETKIENIPGVVDDVNSDSTTDALSAHMGKVLQNQINNLAGMGTFLSNWDCTTGLPETEPVQDPYTYKAGNYYIVSKVSDVLGGNKRPHGSQYNHGVPSSTVETNEIHMNDWYIYDGMQWIIQPAGDRTITIDDMLKPDSRNPVENRAVYSALTQKQDRILDLATIREGAAAGATAIQPGDNISELTNNVGYQTAGDVAAAIEDAIEGSKYVGPTAPSPATEGMLWYDTTNDILKVYDGTNWNPVDTDTTYTNGTYLTLSGTTFDVDTNTIATKTYVDTQVAESISSGSTAPQNPTEGQLWYDTVNHILKIYNGTSWEPVDTNTTYSAGNGLSLNGTEFSADTDILATKTYVDNEVKNAISTGPTAPSNPVIGQLWYDTTNNILKIYDGTNWNSVDTNTTYSAGTGLSLSGTEFSVNTNDIATVSYVDGKIYIGGSAPGVWSEGMLWFDTSVSSLKVYLGFMPGRKVVATKDDISDAAFSSSWDGDTTHAPSKNAIYDVLGDVETLLANL